MALRSTTIELQQVLDRLATDPKAKGEIVTRGMDRLLGVARRLLRSFGGEARVEMWTVDVVNAAYPRLHKALDEVKPATVRQFIGLARLQMKRVLLDKVKVKVPAAAANFDDDMHAAGDGGERQGMLMLDLLETLEQLPAKLSDVVWHRLEGCTFPEIGELLDVHKDTAERYWNQACVKLGKRLAPFMREA